MKKLEVNLTLFDNSKNRAKDSVLNRLEIMFDDIDNSEEIGKFDNIDQFCEWGKKYKITVEEL